MTNLFEPQQENYLFNKNSLGEKNNQPYQQLSTQIIPMIDNNGVTIYYLHNTKIKQNLLQSFTDAEIHDIKVYQTIDKEREMENLGWASFDYNANCEGISMQESDMIIEFPLLLAPSQCKDIEMKKAQSKQNFKENKRIQIFPLETHQTKKIHKQMNVQALIMKQFETKKNREKNTNYPKFLIRLLQRNFEKESKKNVELLSSMKPIIAKIKRLRYKSKGLNMNVISSIIGNNDEHLQQKVIARRILRHILRQNGKDQIIRNNHISQKKKYLKAAKVYSLRCLNRSLVQRIKSK